VYNIHEECCQLPVPESDDTNQNACNADVCGTTIPCSCRLGTGCARAGYMYTSNLEERKMMWYINVSLSSGTSDPLHPTVKVSARVKSQNCVRIALRTYFLPSGVTGLTSHWAVIQLTYWCECEQAPPSEVAEWNVCLYHTLYHKLLAAYIYIMH